MSLFFFGTPDHLHFLKHVYRSRVWVRTSVDATAIYILSACLPLLSYNVYNLVVLGDVAPAIEPPDTTVYVNHEAQPSGIGDGERCHP